MPKILDVAGAEAVVFENAIRPTAGIRQAITMDSALGDGPYRTLHYYQGQARLARPATTIAGAAQARGVSTRTILAHRKALIEAGYLTVSRPEDGPTLITLKDPGRIDRLKEIAARIAAGEAEEETAALDERACLGKLREICPGFNAAGAKKLIRTHPDPASLMALLDQWVAARENIPATWRAGMIYRELEAGNPPPTPPSPRATLRDDPEWAAVFDQQEQAARERIDAEYLALIAGDVADIQPADLPGLFARFREDSVDPNFIFKLQEVQRQP